MAGVGGTETSSHTLPSTVWYVPFDLQSLFQGFHVLETRRQRENVPVRWLNHIKVVINLFYFFRWIMIFKIARQQHYFYRLFMSYLKEPCLFNKFSGRWMIQIIVSLPLSRKRQIIRLNLHYRKCWKSIASHKVIESFISSHIDSATWMRFNLICLLQNRGWEGVV